MEEQARKHDSEKEEQYVGVKMWLVSSMAAETQLRWVEKAGQSELEGVGLQSVSDLPRESRRILCGVRSADASCSRFKKAAG